MYHFFNNTWIQSGQDFLGEPYIQGPLVPTKYGSVSMSLTGDGSMLAIGYPMETPPGSTITGLVYVYERPVIGVHDETNWTQVGSPIEPQPAKDQSGGLTFPYGAYTAFGSSLALVRSENGNVLTVGAGVDQSFGIFIDDGTGLGCCQINAPWIQQAFQFATSKPTSAPTGSPTVKQAPAAPEPSLGQQMNQWFTENETALISSSTSFMLSVLFGVAGLALMQHRKRLKQIEDQGHADIEQTSVTAKVG